MTKEERLQELFKNATLSGAQKMKLREVAKYWNEVIRQEPFKPTFMERVRNGEITDYEPYFHDDDYYYGAERKDLALLGIEVERCIQLNGASLIADLIRAGKYPERYEEWKNHKDERVRAALARNGHYLDELINDSESAVRDAVIRYDIRYALTRMWDEDVRRTIERELIFRKQPDLDVLRAYCEHEKESPLVDIFALIIKRDTTELTTMERTMSRAQLFSMGSPHWTKGFAGKDINTILTLVADVTNKSDFKAEDVIAYVDEKEHIPSVEQMITILKGRETGEHKGI